MTESPAKNSGVNSSFDFGFDVYADSVDRFDDSIFTLQQSIS